MPTYEFTYAEAERLREVLNNAPLDEVTRRLVGRVRASRPLFAVSRPNPDDEDEIQYGLRCPWCHETHWDGEEEGIRVVDVAYRWNSFGYQHATGTIRGSYDNDYSFETDSYVCESCENPVDLPGEISEEGW
jgi:hypothetical protein